jgi:hypothetical protein
MAGLLTKEERIVLVRARWFPLSPSCLNWISEPPRERADRRARFMRRIAAVAEETTIRRMAHDLPDVVRKIVFGIFAEHRNGKAHTQGRRYGPR